MNTELYINDTDKKRFADATLNILRESDAQNNLMN